MKTNKKISPEKVIEILEKYKLKATTRRELPLLTLSIITLSYNKLLKEEMGFSYEAIGAIGGRNTFHSLLNEYHIAKKTEELIETSSDFNNIFDRAKSLFNDFNKELNEVKETINENPENFLKFISRKYPNYMLSIGMYNCFWRYLGDEGKKGKITKELLEKISKERQLIAELYPKVEKLIKSCVDIIGEKNNFDGDLLRYLTLEELKSFLKRQKISKIKLRELKNRRKAYFYLSFENKEYVSTNKDVIDKVNNQFFKIDFKDGIIKGSVAYHGLVKGFVKIVFREQDLSKINKGDILVTPMTSPAFGTILDKVSAIVTDEGGVLSHASIVSREMKKPCIIKTKIATKVLKDGDLVEVDATKGIVKILKRRI